MIVWLVWEFAETPADLRNLLRVYVAGSWVLAAAHAGRLPLARSHRRRPDPLCRLRPGPQRSGPLSRSRLSAGRPARAMRAPLALRLMAIGFLPARASLRLCSRPRAEDSWPRSWPCRLRLFCLPTATAGACCRRLRPAALSRRPLVHRSRVDLRAPRDHSRAAAKRRLEPARQHLVGRLGRLCSRAVLRLRSRHPSSPPRIFRPSTPRTTQRSPLLVGGGLCALFLASLLVVAGRSRRAPNPRSSAPGAGHVPAGLGRHFAGCHGRGEPHHVAAFRLIVLAARLAEERPSRLAACFSDPAAASRRRCGTRHSAVQPSS